MSHKKGDIVLVKSPAGNSISHVHVRLVERVVVKPSKGNTFDWPGYSGWNAELVFQEEVDYLRKEWSIPFKKIGDETFVYDRCIVRKPRNPRPNVKITRTKRKRKKKLK
jgi:hypothetical protein